MNEWMNECVNKLVNECLEFVWLPISILHQSGAAQMNSQDSHQAINYTYRPGWQIGQGKYVQRCRPPSGQVVGAWLVIKPLIFPVITRGSLLNCMVGLRRMWWHSLQGNSLHTWGSRHTTGALTSHSMLALMRMLSAELKSLPSWKFPTWEEFCPGWQTGQGAYGHRHRPPSGQLVIAGSRLFFVLEPVITFFVWFSQ